MAEIETGENKQKVIHAAGFETTEVGKDKEFSKEQRSEYIQKFVDGDGYDMKRVAVELASGDLTFEAIREEVDRVSQKNKETKEVGEKGEGRVARLFNGAREKVQEMGKNFLKWFTETKKEPAWLKEKKKTAREGGEEEEGEEATPSVEGQLEDLKKASKRGLFSESAQLLFKNYETKQKQESKQGKGEETERADAKDVQKRLARYETLIEHQKEAKAKKADISRAERQRDKLREELKEKNNLLKEIEQVEEEFNGDQLVCIYGLSKDVEAINAKARELGKAGEEISSRVGNSKGDLAESVGEDFKSGQSVDDFLKEHCSDDKDFSRCWANLFKGYEKDRKGHEALVKVEKERIDRLQEAIEFCAPGIATIEEQDGIKILEIKPEVLKSVAVRNKLEAAVIREVFAQRDIASSEGFLRECSVEGKSYIEFYVEKFITADTVNDPDNSADIIAIHEVLSKLCKFAPDTFNPQKEKLEKVVSENREAADKVVKEAEAKKGNAAQEAEGKKKIAIEKAESSKSATQEADQARARAKTEAAKAETAVTRARGAQDTLTEATGKRETAETLLTEATGKREEAERLLAEATEAVKKATPQEAPAEAEAIGEAPEEAPEAEAPAEDPAKRALEEAKTREAEAVKTVEEAEELKKAAEEALRQAKLDEQAAEEIAKTAEDLKEAAEEASRSATSTETITVQQAELLDSVALIAEREADAAQKAAEAAAKAAAAAQEAVERAKNLFESITS